MLQSFQCRKSGHLHVVQLVLTWVLFPFLLLGLLFWSFPFFSHSLSFLPDCLLYCATNLICSSANMAHSSNYVRTAPERSRSRDDPMWHSRHPQQRSQQFDPWPETPPAPRLRKVLVIVDLEPVRPLMNKIHDDVMDATTCDVLPNLSRNEELALFTYNVLLNTHRLESFHGVQPALLHQPTHLVHVGSLSSPVLHGHPVARRDWRHFRSPQRGPPC